MVKSSLSPDDSPGLFIKGEISIILLFCNSSHLNLVRLAKGVISLILLLKRVRTSNFLRLVNGERSLILFLRRFKYLSKIITALYYLNRDTHGFIFSKLKRPHIVEKA